MIKDVALDAVNTLKPETTQYPNYADVGVMPTFPYRPSSAV